MKANPLERVIERSCTDASFRAALIARPRETLVEAGIEVPPDVEIRVHENSEERMFIVLPTAGESTLGETRAKLPVGAVANLPAGISMEWRETLNLPRRTLVVRGQINSATSPAFRRELENAFFDVDLDMSGVEHMGSAGLGALVAAQQTLRGRDCALFLRLVPENITHLLEMSGLLNLFDIQDVEEYRQLFPKGAKTLFGGVSPTKPITDQF